MRKGTKHSDKSKRKMSEIRKGKTNYRKGKHLSIETKNKIGLAHKGMKFTKEHIEKLAKAHRGLKRTNQTRELLIAIRKGAKNPAWKGGITPVQYKLRHSIRYFNWRQQVFIRDNFTCQKCGIRGGCLEAHHIKAFQCLLNEVKINLPLLSLYDGAMIYTPLWDVNNGITFCMKCHRKRRM